MQGMMADAMFTSNVVSFALFDSSSFDLVVSSSMIRGAKLACHQMDQLPGALQCAMTGSPLLQGVLEA